MPHYKGLLKAETDWVFSNLMTDLAGNHLVGNVYLCLLPEAFFGDETLWGVCLHKDNCSMAENNLGYFFTLC